VQAEGDGGARAGCCEVDAAAGVERGGDEGGDGGEDEAGFGEGDGEGFGLVELV
jgi:hypothetical protein